MSQKEFALRMGMSEKYTGHLINGKVELTPEISLRPESVLGIPVKFWTNLESVYCERLARVNEELESERDREIAQRFPYAKLVTLGWAPSTRKMGEKAKNLRTCFRVVRFGILDTLRIPGIAYRKMGENETSNYALTVWIQRAKIGA